MHLRWLLATFLMLLPAAHGQIVVSGKTFVRSPNEYGSRGEWVVYEKNAPHDDANRRFLTQKVLVELSGASLQSLRKLPEVAQAEQRGRYAVVTLTGDAGIAISGAKKLRRVQGVLSAEPMLARQLYPKLIPDDPLFAYNAANGGYQWHLRNTGQNGGTTGVDLQVTNVWDTWLGRGIRIGILDDGLQTTHPDLTTNADTVHDRDFNDLDDDPSPTSSDPHGTSCAGVAAARGNNGLGGSGVAPEAQLVGMRLIAGPTTDADEADAFAWHNDIIQVKSSSWGPFDSAFGAYGPGPLSQAALADATTNGRGGRGTIFLWAGGNGGANGDDSNYDGWAASPYAIAVGAVGDDGEAVWYGEPGANLLVCAPSNGGTQGITTTDLMGGSGYDSGDYNHSFGGTSSATPAVAGVVALMLEANPNLGYRDVQEILLRTAVKNDENDGGWARNGAGFDFHPNYGAGMVSAQAAVNLATSWTNIPAVQTRTQGVSALGLEIPDGSSAGLTQSFTVSSVDNLRLEHVTVKVKATHSYRGQLEWWLVSPSGMRSRLARARSNDTGADLDWTFMSTQFWGERSEGVWKLEVYDTDLADAGTLEEATITFFGTPVTTPLPAPVITSNLIIVGREGAVLDHQITASNFATSFFCFGTLPAGVSMSSGGRFSGMPTETGPFYLTMLASNSTGSSFEDMLLYILPADPALSAAVEQPDSLKIVPFGYANWFSQTAITHDGVDAAQSEPIDHEEYAGMEFTVTGPTRLSYQWKVSSEPGYDYLVLTVDGYVKAYITGEVDWTQVTQDIGPGDHNVDIYYLKDEAVATGQDAGWVDELTLTPIISAPVVTGGTVHAYEGTPLKHQVQATNAPTAYSATGLPAGLTISPTTGLIYGTTNVVGIHTVTLQAENPFGTGSATLNVEVGSISQGLAAALDAPLQTIQSSGTRGWRAQSLYASDGSDAARSGDIQDMQDSRMSTQIMGPAKIAFTWGISSEADYDYLRFHIDGVEQEAISGEVGWTKKTFTVPEGPHTLQWSYIKDEFVRGGLDSGFVDQLGVYGDADQDGFWSDEETAFGTSDLDPGLLPRVSIVPSGANTVITFPSVAGQAYRIQYSTDLQNWTNVNVTATSSSTTWTDSSATGQTRRFYRVALP
jgi:subtilisin-like proprotein convertase family protein